MIMNLDEFSVLLNQKSIKHDLQNIDDDIQQIIFKLNDKEVNIFLCEETHIKMFISLNKCIKDMNVEKALEKINDINVTDNEITLALLGDNKIYITKSIVFIGEVDWDKIFSVIQEIVDRSEKVVSNFIQL